jgi:hypothetical protein
MSSQRTNQQFQCQLFLSKIHFKITNQITRLLNLLRIMTQNQKRPRNQELNNLQSLLKRSKQKNHQNSHSHLNQMQCQQCLSNLNLSQMMSHLQVQYRI